MPAGLRWKVLVVANAFNSTPNTTDGSAGVGAAVGARLGATNPVVGTPLTFTIAEATLQAWLNSPATFYGVMRRSGNILVANAPGFELPGDASVAFGTKEGSDTYAAAPATLAFRTADTGTAAGPRTGNAAVARERSRGRPLGTVQTRGAGRETTVELTRR